MPMPTTSGEHAYADYEGEYDRAIQDFTEAIRLFPNEANAYSQFPGILPYVASFKTTSRR